MSKKLQRMCSKAKQLLKNTNGQGLVEYALILVLVAIVVIAALKSIGSETNKVFCNVSDHIRLGN
ncbi:Flp family type IVb pilin [Geoanaerobacter pelophilus]|jgi:pilus assembly protein Flp/PilA|nr:Flp family type IVb pilin [Geoanaerobacter pelophilus]